MRESVFQNKYREDSRRSISSCLYSQLPETPETQFVRTVTELQSDVSKRLAWIKTCFNFLVQVTFNPGFMFTDIPNRQCESKRHLVVRHVLYLIQLKWFTAHSHSHSVQYYNIYPSDVEWILWFTVCLCSFRVNIKRKEGSRRLALSIRCCRRLWRLNTPKTPRTSWVRWKIRCYMSLRTRVSG